MASKLSPSDLAETVEELFKSGMPAIKFLALEENKAREYDKALKSQGYKTRVNGPSFDNDPLKERMLYSVIVINRSQR